MTSLKTDYADVRKLTQSQVLGIASAADDAAVRAAYRRQVLTTHPDKGGSAEAFNAIIYHNLL